MNTPVSVLPDVEDYVDTVLAGTYGSHFRIIQGLDVIQLTPEQAKALLDALKIFLGIKK